MDKVQIYYLVLLSLTVLVRTLAGIFDPDSPQTNFTNAQAAILQPIGFLVALPVIGRIFGWW